MLRIILIAALFFAAACNSEGDKAKEESKAATTGGAASTASSWNKEDENEMMDGCIENARTRFGEDTAYAYCKCVLKQIMARYPNPDSANNALMDTAYVSGLAANCR